MEHLAVGDFALFRMKKEASAPGMMATLWMGKVLRTDGSCFILENTACIYEAPQMSEAGKFQVNLLALTLSTYTDGAWPLCTDDYWTYRKVSPEDEVYSVYQRSLTDYRALKSGIVQPTSILRK